MKRNRIALLNRIQCYQTYQYQVSEKKLYSVHIACTIEEFYFKILVSFERDKFFYTI